MSNYAAGTRVEHHNRDHLTADGYVVLRTAGSKGFVDLIAIKPGQLLLVQSKGNGRITAADWNQLLERAAWVGAVPILASRDLASGCREKHRPEQATPQRCATVLWRLSGLYVPRAPFARQPCELFLTDEIAGQVPA